MAIMFNVGERSGNYFFEAGVSCGGLRGAPSPNVFGIW
jgi:hypothetical protein